MKCFFYLLVFIAWIFNIAFDAFQILNTWDGLKRKHKESTKNESEKKILFENKQQQYLADCRVRRIA